MILRVLITVSVLQLTVTSDLVFPELLPGDGISQRYVSSDKIKPDSYVSRILECDKLEELKKKIEIFPFLIDLDVRQKKEGKSHTNGKCTVYFANVPRLDFSLAPRRYTIARSFIFMLDQYRGTEYFKELEITLESFSYSPLLQRFVFVDIEKLDIKEKQTKNTKEIYKKMVNTFYNSLISKVTLISSEISIFKKINNDIVPSLKNTELNHLEYFRTVNNNKKIETFLDLTQSNSSNEKQRLELNIRTSKINNQMSVYYTVNSYTTSFALENKNDLIMFFICKRDKDKTSLNEDDSCINVFGDQIDWFDFKGISSMSTRYNVEIQESKLSYLDNGVGKVKKLFEIYIVILPETIHGIIPDSIFLHTESSKDYLQEVDFILCQNSLNDLVMYSKVDNNIEKKEFKFGKNIINVLGKAHMYQTTTSLLSNEFTECQKPLTRVFIIKKNEYQLIFGLDGSDDSKIVRSIYTRPRTGGAPYLIIKECQEQDRTFQSIELSNNEKLIKRDKEQKEYSLEVFLRFSNDNSNDKKEITSGKNIESDCYNLDTMTGFKLYHINEKNRYSNFYWNFNLESELPLLETERTIVYVSKKQRTIDPNFNFGSLVLPMFTVKTLFVSITKDNSSLPYRIRFVNYISDNIIEEVLFSDDKKSRLKILPFGFKYNLIDSNYSTENSFKNFEKREAVYLSENEIVYQVEYQEYKNCNRLLELEDNGDYVNIVCKLIEGSSRVVRSPSAESYKPSLENGKENLFASPGLYRVLRQAKEIESERLKKLKNNPIYRILI